MVAHRAIPLYLLFQAVAALGAVVKRESSSGCLYQFVTQPRADILSVCNPFEQQNSLTLECSILVMDNVPGEVTIQWVHKDQLSREETVLSTSTTAHNQGDTITSTITVSCDSLACYIGFRGGGLVHWTPAVKPGARARSTCASFILVFSAIRNTAKALCMYKYIRD